jgi:hypothetical protein
VLAVRVDVNPPLGDEPSLSFYEHGHRAAELEAMGLAFSADQDLLAASA